MKKLFLISLLTLFITSCGAGSTSYEPYDEIEGTAKLPAMVDNTTTYHEMPITYKDEYFFLDSSSFNLGLANLSFALSNTNVSLEYATDFFNTISFDNFHASASYYTGQTENSHSMVLAHKRIRDYDLVAVSFIGGNYGLEWVSNFDVGSSGDHNGFSYSASNAINELKKYLSNKNYNLNKVKLWISGYSRGGALANILANRLPTTLNINNKNIYTYTFEAPRGIEKNNIKGYTNVFNIINSYDIVQSFLPKEYNLYREGIDVDIYSDSLNTYIDLTLPNIAHIDFIPEEKNPTPKDFLVNLIQEVLAIKGKAIAISTREKYVQNLQDALKGFAGVLGQCSFFTIMDIFGGLKDKDLTELVSIIATKDGLYNYLAPELDKYHITYDEETLKKSCNTLTSIMMNYYISLYSFTEHTENYLGLVLNHIPEYNYCLLKHYQAN